MDKRKRWLCEHAQAGRLAKQRFKYLQRNYPKERGALRVAFAEVVRCRLAVLNLSNAIRYNSEVDYRGITIMRVRPRSSNDRIFD